MVQSTAYRVTPPLLAREDFRAACTARDFGALFALMKKYDGASQDRISSPVEGLTQSRVSRIMHGDDRVSSLDLIERIVDGLRIPGSYLGLAAREWETDTPPEPSPAPGATVTPIHPRAAAPLPAAATPGTGLRVNGTPILAPDPALDEEQRRYAPHRTERPVGLRPHIERAFAEPAVTIDFAGFSGETLAGALSEPLDKVRSGRLTPTSIRIRALVPDTTRPWALPCRIEDLGDEPAFRDRAAGIADRSLSSILDAMTELRDLDLVSEAVAEVRVHGLAPLFKLYLINGREAFFGFYPITEHVVKAGGGVHSMYDLMGKDSLLFQHSIDDAEDTSAAAAYVTQARMWFDSVWATVARDYDRP
jgi:hypothetical protein